MNTKAMMIIGIILVVAGGLALYFGGIPVEREALNIGEASIGYTETRQIPEWLSGGIIGVGAILFIFGFSKKK
ncbi:MAG: hypothetical protein R3270_07930 [Gammaproteobacteria bacterium]|nr:hypothetical protein [Gammaproteobacteria bacterium]